MRAAGQKGPRRQAPRQHQQQQPHVLSNLQSFLIHTAPCLPLRTSAYDDLEGLSSGAYPHFTLRDLWQSYEAWSAYGCEVPMRINVDGVWQEVIQCYTPHLSGLQLFGADHARRLHASSSSAAVSSGYGSDDEGEGCGPPPSTCSAADSSDCTSACSTATASTASTTSDSDSEDAWKDSPHAPDGFPPAAARLAARRASDCGSVLRKHRVLGEPGAPLLEYFEVERPHLRVPLHDQIMELAEQCPELLSLDCRDLHPASWFAVTWVPIYRVPSVPDPASSRDLQANFLTFHALAPPSPRLHAPASEFGRSLAPLPPLLDPIGAAAVAWRTEVARQQLLAAAVSAVTAAQAKQQQQLALAAAATAAEQQESQAAPASGNSGTVSSCVATSSAPAASSLASQLAQASAEGRAAAAAAAAQLARMPLAATCLRPFAFMPYKAAGATWVDDWNLQRQHLPMIAAAGSWIERRKVQLPDFDFMSQMYRPLPSGYQQYRDGR